jgi:hypothetical protein
LAAASDAFRRPKRDGMHASPERVAPRHPSIDLFFQTTRGL